MAARSEAGLPNRFGDLVRADLSDEQNAAYFIQRAVPWAEGICQDMREIFQSPEFEQQQLTAEMATRIADLDDAFERMIEPLERAAELEEYQSLHLTGATSVSRTVQVGDLLEKSSESRCISRALQLRALQCLHDQRPDAAFDVLLLHLAIARHLMHEPAITGYLVALGCRQGAELLLVQLLATAPLSDEQQRRLNDELARYDSMKPVQQALQTEAIFGLGMLREMSTSWLMRPLTNHWQCIYLQRMTALENAAEAQGSFQYETEKPSEGWRHWRDFPVELIEPAMEAYLGAAGYGLARMRCLRILNALAGQLATNPDQEPSVDDLGLPASAVRDPFSSSVLQLKNSDEGWLVYSVGKNGEDDGGDFEQYKDVGFLFTNFE